MNYWPYLVALVVLIGLMAFSVRNRRRQMAEQAAQAERIAVGTEVMTTSGLYGTVVGRNPDDTVMLSIAPGVEVKWAVAALRDAASLSTTYRRAISGDEPGVDEAASGPPAADAAARGDEPSAEGIDLDVDGKTYDDAGHEVQLHKSHETPRRKSRGPVRDTHPEDPTGS